MILCFIVFLFYYFAVAYLLVHMARFPSMDDKCSVLYLSRLHLDDLSLDHLTDSKRQQIQHLHLTYNRLSFLPPSVCFLSNLEYLDISNNALTVIPDDIMRLTNLKTFVAKNNLLNESSFPKEFERMQVETLNLSGNRFEDIPMQCLKMTTLQSLSLGGNRLKNIPAEIESLTRYEFVSLFRYELSLHMMIQTTK